MNNKILLCGVILGMLGSSFIAPVASVVQASEIDSEVENLQQGDINTNKEITIYKMKFNNFLENKKIGNLDLLTESEKEKLVTEFLDSMPQTRNPAAVVAAIVGICWTGIQIGKAGYALGQWAAKEVLGRGVCSRATYKQYRWVWRASLLSVLSVVGVVGFDDYMYQI